MKNVFFQYRDGMLKKTKSHIPLPPVVTLTTSNWVSSNRIFRKHPRLQSLEHCNSLRALKPHLAFALVSGLFRNPFVASRLLLSAATASPPLAALIFAQTPSPNLFSFNTLIRAIPSNAHQLYVEMLHRGQLPDNFTHPFLLESCADVDSGRRVHAHASILGFLADPFVHTALVRMYLSSGPYVDDVLKLFDEMPQRDVVAWTAVISGLADCGFHCKALLVFNSMKDARPNAATAISVMSACGGFGSLDRARSLHTYFLKLGFLGVVFVGNSLIDAYSKCGSVDSATRVFDGMWERDLHSWTSMINGLASHGLGREALDLFSRMGVRPDSVTFVAVLSACSHAGLVNEGTEIFDSMYKVYGIDPEEKHCGCMVDLFSRAGLLSRAYEFIMSMPVEPNLPILGSLLSACRVNNDLELGELVAKKIESLCRYRGGVHVLLSNMYANRSQWVEVVSIREETRGVQGKPPAQSWIEVRGVVHEFGVEDRSNPHAREMYLVLDGLGKLME